MKRLLPLMLLALVSCGRPAPQQLTLLTYNVGVFSKYLDNSTPQVAALIRESGASFVALNELDSCNRRHDTYQLANLAEELGWSYHYASAIPYAGGAYGNGVVTSHEIVKRDKIELPKVDGAEMRSVAVIETPECVFAAVHLDHRSQVAAREQMNIVNHWFTYRFTGAKKPVFLCGDFNVTPDSDVIALAETCWTLLSGTGYTHSTTRPRHCIDYVFALKAAAPVRVLGSQVLTEGTSDLSDHYPVKVTVEF